MWRSLARFCKQGILCSNTHLNSTGHVVCYLAADGKKQNGIDGTEGLCRFPQVWCFFWVDPCHRYMYIHVYVYSIHVYIICICIYIYIYIPLVIFVFLVYGPVFGWLKPNICKTSSQARTHDFAQHTINRC